MNGNVKSFIWDMHGGVTTKRWMMRETTRDPMTLETTINDLIEQNTKLGRERAAAVNQFTCILALAPAIFRWKAKLEKFWRFSELARGNMKKIDDYVTRVQQSLLLTSEILQNHGYNVINVEEGNHGEIKKRNKCFSALREFSTTMSETQAGGGQIGLQVAASGWKKILRFGDGVWPPEPPRTQIPEWVTIPDPTVPAPRVNRFGPRPPSRTTAWIQSTTTTLSIGATTTAEGKTDITIGTIKTECIGITVIEFGWATTATATGGTQTSGKAHAKA